MPQRKFLRIFVNVLVACVLALFAIYTLALVFDADAQQRYLGVFDHITNVASAENRRVAFATAVSDVSMLNATLVALFALKQQVGTQVEVVLLLPDAQQHVITDSLGVHVIQTVAVRSGDPASIVLQLWTLTYYDKIVYFSANVLFTKNVDHVLDYPSHASSDGSSWLVLEPSVSVVDKYLSSPYSVTDFLTQVYWDGKIRKIPDGMHVFAGAMKPWNFHTHSSPDWRDAFQPAAFYTWRQLYDRLFSFNQTTWPNHGRRESVCANYPHHPFPVNDKFSVLVSTYNPERIEHVSLLIHHLLRSPLVATVFVTWHNPLLTVPEALLLLEQQQHVVILKQSYDSLNNRFNPISSLQTSAVYIVDDDIFVDLDDMEFAFETWRLYKDSIIGHFPRIHTYNPATQQGVYKVANYDRYSMVLTKSMFVPSEYLFAYTCVLDTSIHRIVDDMTNCEDIAFAMMASGMSGANAIAATPTKPIRDYGLNVGISTNNQHMGARGMCVGTFISQFWRGRDPLIVSRLAVVPYKPPTIRRGHWNHIDTDIKIHSV